MPSIEDPEALSAAVAGMEDDPGITIFDYN